MNRKEMAKLVSMVADDEEKKAIKNGDLDMLYEVVTKSPFGRYLDGSEVQSLTFLRNAIRIVKEVIEEVK